MTVGVYQLLHSKKREFELKILYYDSLKNYWTAKAELDHVLGGDLALLEQRAKMQAEKELLDDVN